MSEVAAGGRLPAAAWDSMNRVKTARQARAPIWPLELNIPTGRMQAEWHSLRMSSKRI
jgi:hypothetical protein